MIKWILSQVVSDSETIQERETIQEMILEISLSKNKWFIYKIMIDTDWISSHQINHMIESQFNQSKSPRKIWTVTFSSDVLSIDSLSVESEVQSIRRNQKVIATISNNNILTRSAATLETRRSDWIPVRRRSYKWSPRSSDTPESNQELPPHKIRSLNPVVSLAY